MASVVLTVKIGDIATDPNLCRRDALRDIGAVGVDIGAAGFVLPDDVEVEPDVDPWCALLPGLDIATMGWFDRDWYLGGHRAQIFDRNGNGGPMT